MKAARKARGWTQDKLSARSGITRADISRMESGRLIPYRHQAEALARTLGLKPDELQEEVEIAS